MSAPSSESSASLPGRHQHPGHIDLYCYSPDLQRFIICGWLSHRLTEEIENAVCLLKFSDQEVSASLDASFYRREGLGELGAGMVMFISVAERPSGQFISLTLYSDEASVSLTPGKTGREISESALSGWLKPLLGDMQPPVAASIIQTILPELPAPVEAPEETAPEETAPEELSFVPEYLGKSTLDTLTDLVLMEIDASISCRPNGLAMIGWLLARPGTIREIRLRSHNYLSVIDFDRFIRYPRPGVIEAAGGQYGFEDERCGFITFFPEAFSPVGPTYLEVETTRGELAFVRVPTPKLSGLGAIRQLLGDCDIQYEDVSSAFENVLGPAITALNEERFITPPRVATVQFGERPVQPDCSVIIPLYSRLDYLELQCALLARDSARSCEIILVLDDPPKRREAENLAAAISARLGIPLSLVLLSRNTGFACASNIGLRAARGKYVCFLNSDAFPQTRDWLNELCGRLDDDPDLGVVGPLLTYDDGSIQHQGMVFQQVPQFANWNFNSHVRCGWRPPSRGGLHPVMAVTGACMVMRSEVANQLSGFDQGYVIGGFEDSDLCLRIRQLGLGCAVDFDVKLVHLAGKSMPGPDERWRMNLTLYNAWLHNQRWGSTMLDPARLADHPEQRRIGVVVPVAPFGRPVPQEPWRRFRQHTGVPVVIDGAASFEGLEEAASSYLGDIPVALSFHATKSFSTGEGGGVGTSDCVLARGVAQTLNFGFYGSRDSEVASTNGKLSEYHAAVGLAELDGWNGKRGALRGVADLYRELLERAGLLDRLYGAPHVAGCYALFRCSNEEQTARVQASLDQHGIDFRLWYGGGLHHQTYFADLSGDALDVTEKISGALIGLPVAPDMSKSAITRVIAALTAGL